MWLKRKLDVDRVARLDFSTSQYDAHHPGGPLDIAFAVLEAEEAHQTALEVVDLAARISQSGQLDDRFGSQPQHGAGWQAEQINSARGDILTELTGCNHVSTFRQHCQELLLDQMHLAEVRLGGVPSHQVPVFHELSRVGVPGHTQALEEGDRRPRSLAETVLGAGGNGNDRRSHDRCRRAGIAVNETVERPTERTRGESISRGYRRDR